MSLMAVQSCGFVDVLNISLECRKENNNGPTANNATSLLGLENTGDVRRGFRKLQSHLSASTGAELEWADSRLSLEDRETPGESEVNTQDGGGGGGAGI